ncbi:2-amino-4-hydroxy-6-hydroxymethyldihydropteridine diphosphokinase [Candidatus Neomarinimicrobiota bacterium]
MARTGFIGLGSNVGSRQGNLQRAIDRLSATEGIEVTLQSQIYESAPVDVVIEQGDYLNQVVGIESGLSPVDLRQVCVDIEYELGREIEHRSGLPRTIDLDIISLGNLAGGFENVKLPHPRYSRRRFVLQPLADIAPHYRDPVTGHNVSYMLENCDAEDLRVFPIAEVEV